MQHADALSYGQHRDQHLVLVRADAPVRGTVVLVHGGYWRQAHTLALMEPLIQPFLDAGWNVANVEYRRGPEAVWPAPVDDVRAACALVSAHGPGGPLMALGHSVGGELALLAGDPVEAVVALAPVTDAARAHAERLGEGAAQEYFGLAPTRDPVRYADASPIARLCAGRPTLVVHGADDARVPIRHTLDYLVAAWEAGVAVTALLPDRLGHLEVIDPTRGHWANVVNWMNAIAAGVHHDDGSSTASA